MENKEITPSTKSKMPSMTTEQTWELLNNTLLHTNIMACFLQLPVHVNFCWAITGTNGLRRFQMQWSTLQHPCILECQRNVIFIKGKLIITQKNLQA